MGFNIGSFLKTLAGPVIGGLIGGPAGVLVGSALTGAFAPARGVPGPTIIGGSGTRTLPGGSSIPPLVISGGRALAAGGVIAGILALSRNNTGRPASAKKIREAARVCGIDVAASTFGISVNDVCTIIVSRRSRRGRGISAADLRRTRSTIRKITTMQHSLAHFVGHQKRGPGGKFV